MSMLDSIVAHKRKEVALRAAAMPLEALRLALPLAEPLRSFSAALSARPAVIAEIKRRSPSRGELRPGLDAAELAREYEAAGAAALSVLTDEQFFGMRLAELSAARVAVELPVLRKDFILDEYMLIESRLLGADAVLLIAAILDTGELRRLIEQTSALGMDALVEVHDEAELARALDCAAKLIGINARNLHSFTVDLDTVRRVAQSVPQDVLLVAESGIHTKQDIDSLGHAGARAFLIGEVLLCADSPGRMLGELLGREVRA